MFKNKFNFELPTIIFLIIFLFFTVIYLTSTRVNILFGTNWGIDQAFFLQTIYNTSRGDILQNSISIIPELPAKNFNFLVLRFSPIMLIPAFIYKIIPSFFVLMIFEVSLVCLSSIPLFLLARLKLKNDYLPLIIVYVFFMHPILNQVLLEEFRVPVLAIFFFFCAFLFYEKRKLLFMYLSLFFAAITQEQSILYVGLFGFWITLFDRRGLRKQGLMIFLIGFVFFLFVIFIAQPMLLKSLADSTQTKMINDTISLGYLSDFFRNNLIERKDIVLSFTFMDRVMFYFKEMIIPLAFIPLINSVSLIAIPEVFQNIIIDYSRGGFNTKGMQWHNVYFMTFSVISLIYFLSNFKIHKVRLTLFIILFVSSTFFGIENFEKHLHLIKMYGFKNLWTNNTSWYLCITDLKKSLSAEASVVSQAQIMPLLSDRKRLDWDVLYWRSEKYEEFLPEYFVLNGPAPDYFDLYTANERPKFLSIFLSNYEFEKKSCFVYLYKNKALKI